MWVSIRILTPVMRGYIWKEAMIFPRRRVPSTVTECRYNVQILALEFHSH